MAAIHRVDSVGHLGGKAHYSAAYSRARVFVGSEGTLGVATKIILRIVKQPECIRTLLAAFPSTNEAGAAVSGIIAGGKGPGGGEKMGKHPHQGAGDRRPANQPACWGRRLARRGGALGGRGAV